MPVGIVGSEMQQNSNRLIMVNHYAIFMQCSTGHPGKLGANRNFFHEVGHHSLPQFRPARDREENILSGAMPSQCCSKLTVPPLGRATGKSNNETATSLKVNCRKVDLLVFWLSHLLACVCVY